MPGILKRSFFGDFRRFELVKFETRFNTTEWMVTDAEQLDYAGKPEIVLQADSLDEVRQAMRNRFNTVLPF